MKSNCLASLDARGVRILSIHLYSEIGRWVGNDNNDKYYHYLINDDDNYNNRYLMCNSSMSKSVRRRSDGLA